MKWAGMYLVGFAILLGGIGIMFSVANSGGKENIQIDRKCASLACVSTSG